MLSDSRGTRAGITKRFTSLGFIVANAYFKWKEQLVYEEEGRVLVFEAPMGVSPSDVYVPTAELWTIKVPPWARDKRDEVMRVIRGVEGLGKVVETPDAWVEDHTW